MRSLALLLLLAPLAGCLGGLGGEEPLPPVVSAGVIAHRAEGDKATRTATPADLANLRFTAADTGERGAEPTIGITPRGTILAQAYETTLRSRDGIAWEKVHTAGFGQSFDPMLWVDAITGRALYLHIYPERTCSTISVSTDDGVTWTERPMACPSPVVDHQKLATGPAAGPLAPLAAASGGGRLTSLCYNAIGATRCAVSTDGGLTFGQDVAVDGLGTGLPVVGGSLRGVTGDCGGLNGHQHHAADGAIYVPYGYACQESRVAVSIDGGLTWTRHAPRHGELEIDPELATTPDGTAYYLYRGSDQRMHLLRSQDRFKTVEGPFAVSPPQVRATVFAGLAAGSDGRIAFAYLGSADSSAAPDEAPASATWHLFAGMSLDADSEAPTFATVQVTPDGDPVQRGSICHSQECKDGNRNLLDFIDLSMGPDGRPWIAFADGCTSDACREPGQTDVQTSRDDRLVVAHLSQGPSLLEGRGRLGPVRG